MTLLELERRSITRFGLSPSDFWESTPKELDMKMEQFVYIQQLEMNHTRHIMAAVANTVVNTKKRPKGFAPKDIMELDMLDGKSEDQLIDGQKQADDALKYFKQLKIP